MKRFLAYAQDLEPGERAIWEQAGFDIMAAYAAATGDEDDLPIDLALLNEPFYLLESISPRMFMAPVQTAGDAPPDWQRRYEMRFYGTGSQGWWIGTKAEAPLPDDWGASRREECGGFRGKPLLLSAPRCISRNGGMVRAYVLGGATSVGGGQILPTNRSG